MVWGTFLEKNFPSSNGHLLDFGGSEPLPGWFGPLIYRQHEKIVGLPLFALASGIEFTFETYAWLHMGLG